MPSVVGGLFYGIHEESINLELIYIYIYIAYIMLAAFFDTLSWTHTTIV